MARRDVFQAIADPRRREIMNIIALDAKTPSTIAEHFRISRQAVSKHLQILFESDLVSQKQVGREIYYHFNLDSLRELDQFLEPFRKLWENRYDKLEQLLNQQMEENNEPKNKNKKKP
ncbi:MAG: transcriptional regulator [Proteobacteria bacterium SG_bin7]|nr:MAG: transcriptional regulator [Proteobacteria bacterium SG_bin7]